MKIFCSVAFLAVLTIFAIEVNSQNVGISSEAIVPDASSMLEVRSLTSGVLIPRVALTATNVASPIIAPASSLLVYNTATAGTGTTAVTPGYYYNAGTSTSPNWVRFSTARAGWELMGNTGTNPTNNWLGTNDAADFAIRTGGIATTNERMRITSSGPVLVNHTTAVLPDGASKYAAFNVGGSASYEIGVYAFDDALDRIPLMIQQNNKDGNAIYALNNAAPGAGGGNAITAYSKQTGSATISAGLQSQNTYAPAAISGVVASTIPKGKGIIGVCDNASGVGVQGQSTGSGGYGVAGYGDGSGSYTTGVFGSNSNGPGTGVWGQSYNVNGDGVVGVNGASASSNGTGSGVYGETTQQKGVGVLGTNLYGSSGTGVGGVGSGLGGTPYLITSGAGGSFKSTGVGVFGWSYSLNSGSMGGAFYLGNSTNLNNDYFAYVCANIGGTLYKIYGNGTVSTIVKRKDNTKAVMFCPEAPEIFFQDYGSGQLSEGKAYIKIDPVLANNIKIDKKHPLRVYVQLEDECNGVYVTNKTIKGFEVVELQGGKSDAKFSYQIVANRADETNDKGEVISKNFGLRFPDAMSPIKLIDDDSDSEMQHRKSSIRKVDVAQPSK